MRIAIVSISRDARGRGRRRGHSCEAGRHGRSVLRRRAVGRHDDRGSICGSAGERSRFSAKGGSAIYDPAHGRLIVINLADSSYCEIALPVNRDSVLAADYKRAARPLVLRRERQADGRRRKRSAGDRAPPTRTSSGSSSARTSSANRKRRSGSRRTCRSTGSFSSICSSRFSRSRTARTLYSDGDEGPPGLRPRGGHDHLQSRAADRFAARRRHSRRRRAARRLL